MPSVLWRCWLGGRKGIQPVKTEWWGTGVVICLERGANDLHMVQLMPLPSSLAWWGAVCLACFDLVCCYCCVIFTFLVCRPSFVGIHKCTVTELQRCAVLLTQISIDWLIDWLIDLKRLGDGGGEHWLVWMEWHPARWLVCLPLLIFPYTIKSRSSLLAPAHSGGPEKRAVKWLWWW